VNRPLVSVVVCTRDRNASLERCLRSLRDQTQGAHEVIVVDNDPRKAPAAEIAARYDARYVVEPRRGHNRARNTGARLAKGDAIAFTDDDITADEGWIESIAQEFEDPQVMIVTGQVLLTGEEGDDVWMFTRRERRFFTRADPDWFEIANFGGIGNGANMAFRRSLLTEWRGFDERLGLGTRVGCEEHYAFFQCLEAGHAAVATPDAVVFHPRIADSGRRRRAARLASASYFLFLLINEPRHRRRIARYILGGLRREPRQWRGR
jgi:glycosyltransferase involved in cell wall biosynthesis